jgi:hypothetical protein
MILDEMNYWIILINSDKIMMKAELLIKFYNTFAHYYDKDSILKLLFIIIKINNFNNYENIRDQFENGYWSANNITTVIVHEYGHAIENFLNSLFHTRSRFNSNYYPCEDKNLNPSQ